MEAKPCVARSDQISEAIKCTDIGEERSEKSSDVGVWGMDEGVENMRLDR